MQQDDQTETPMEDEERQHLREMRRIHQSRLHVLEQQQAAQGIQTPPHIVTEIADIRRQKAYIKVQLGHRTSTVDHTALREIWRQALTASNNEEWEQVEDLLLQILTIMPENGDAQKLLNQAQQRLDSRALYQAICDLRDAGHWGAVLTALDELDSSQSVYPNQKGLRVWAEQRLQLRRTVITTCRDLVLLVKRQDWSDGYADKLDHLVDRLDRQSSLVFAATVRRIEPCVLKLKQLIIELQYLKNISDSLDLIVAAPFIGVAENLREIAALIGGNQQTTIIEFYLAELIEEILECSVYIEDVKLRSEILEQQVIDAQENSDLVRCAEITRPSISELKVEIEKIRYDRGKCAVFVRNTCFSSLTHISHTMSIQKHKARDQLYEFVTMLRSQE